MIIVVVILLLTALAVGIYFATKKDKSNEGDVCEPTDDEKVENGYTYNLNSDKTCVPSTCIVGYNLSDGECLIEEEEEAAPVFNDLNYNTLYTAVGIGQGPPSGTTVVWGDDKTTTVYLNKSEPPFSRSEKDVIKEGDSFVMQVPIAADDKNQGCTNNCGQYGCRTLQIVADNPDKTAAWGHGGTTEGDPKKCKADYIKESTKLTLKKGDEDNTYLITDGAGVEHKVKFVKQTCSFGNLNTIAAGAWWDGRKTNDKAGTQTGKYLKATFEEPSNETVTCQSVINEWKAAEGAPSWAKHIMYNNDYKIAYENGEKIHEIFAPRTAEVCAELPSENPCNNVTGCTFKDGSCVLA